ncbi:MAG: anthranilate phosphoribosyltransferase [Hyphomicrobiaceae bacterium]|nr:anthranilate phosphoribosyltransferase [Hyphomicrobiaceae bacterium]
MTDQSLLGFIKRLSQGTSLDRSEIKKALDIVMSNNATSAQMSAFIMALRLRGETIDEITGAAEFLRQHMTIVTAPVESIDIVGTGGDNHSTFNISTCSALVAASTGLIVAKHGNRSVSSKSGASDVLEALGVKVTLLPEEVSHCISSVGIGFMWAPVHHPAMKQWSAIRKELGIRTIFNTLGPICNPALVRRQIIGVYSIDLIEPIAYVLKNLGSERVWVVHGHDGMDEITTTGATYVAELKDGVVNSFKITPSDAGLPYAKLSDLIGGDAKTNAYAIQDLLAGKRSPFRDVVILNTAAAMVVSNKAPTLIEGAEKAAHAIDSGLALNKLKQLIYQSNKS